jgi:hypothetical protein
MVGRADVGRVSPTHAVSSDGPGPKAAARLPPRILKRAGLKR